jgi:hypothetical protein
VTFSEAGSLARSGPAEHSSRGNRSLSLHSPGSRYRVSTATVDGRADRDYGPVRSEDLVPIHGPLRRVDINTEA